ncbi:MAG: hypothetical protein KBE23_16925 [Chloroflexi bacterium]|nr:hypothetical protein [Chloroflexota bacterium]
MVNRWRSTLPCFLAVGERLACHCGGVMIGGRDGRLNIRLTTSPPWRGAG